MVEMTMFLGKPVSYWIEVSKRINDLGSTEHLLNEVVILSAKVNYYESQIKRMEEFRKAADHG